jgi:hypothetical protein
MACCSATLPDLLTTHGSLPTLPGGRRCISQQHRGMLCCSLLASLLDASATLRLDMQIKGPDEYLGADPLARAVFFASADVVQQLPKLTRLSGGFC